MSAASAAVSRDPLDFGPRHADVLQRPVAQAVQLRRGASLPSRLREDSPLPLHDSCKADRGRKQCDRNNPRQPKGCEWPM